MPVNAGTPRSLTGPEGNMGQSLYVSVLGRERIFTVSFGGITPNNTS